MRTSMKRILNAMGSPARLLRRASRLPRALSELSRSVAHLSRHADSTRALAGRIAVRQVAALPSSVSLREAEFSVYSQFGDDGIIQYLIRHVPRLKPIFIEFGV